MSQTSPQRSAATDAARYAIYGAGGFGREVAPLLPMATDAVFVSDRAEDRTAAVNGRPVLDFQALCSNQDRDRRVIVAIGAPPQRAAIVARCAAEGLVFGEVTAPTHRRLENVTIGEGSICCDYSMITSDAEIGTHFHLNLYSYVAHDVRIGNFVTFAPRVCCNGNIEIGDGVYVGTGAVLREGRNGMKLRIGAGAVIGMGAIVTKDVPAGATVYGNPARIVTVDERKP